MLKKSYFCFCFFIIRKHNDSDEELLKNEEPKKEETKKEQKVVEKVNGKPKKPKMSNEELKKILDENPCIEDLKNGLYRCELCKRNINSKSQIVSHLGSSL